MKKAGEEEEGGAGGHDAPNWSRVKSASVLMSCTILYAIIAGQSRRFRWPCRPPDFFLAQKFWSTLSMSFWMALESRRSCLESLCSLSYRTRPNS